MTGGKPNPAHVAIAGPEQMDKLYGVITQNEDDLHQKAGVSDDMLFQPYKDISQAKCLICGKWCPKEETAVP